MVEAVLPCPGFGAEPLEIRPKRGGGKIREGRKDAYGRVRGAPPAKTGGERPIKSARPRRAIREIRERRGPLEPPKNVRTGANIPEDGDEGAAHRGGRVAAYKALQRAGIIDAQRSGGEPIATQVDGHTRTKDSGGKFVGEKTRIASRDGRESTEPRRKVGGSRRRARAKTDRGGHVAKPLRIGMRTEGERKTKRGKTRP